MNKNSSKKTSKTDWKRVDEASDAAVDDSEITEQHEDFFKNAALRTPETKAVVTLEVDKGVSAWFKKHAWRCKAWIYALLKAKPDNLETWRV